VPTSADSIDLHRGAVAPALDAPAGAGADALPGPVLRLGPGPMARRAWLATMAAHLDVLLVLARQDFHVRFKRAALGVLWAVAVPAVQAVVMIVVFSHFVRAHHGVPYGAYVLSGILPWSYFMATMPSAVTAIVDGSGMTDKVWFPRALLPLVPCLSGLVGLAISMVILVIVAPLLGAAIAPRIVLLIPACLLLFVITSSLGLVLAALQVYYRDVRFIVIAALGVWLYATPIMYARYNVGRLGPWLDFNPMTGVVSVFHLAVIGDHGPWLRAVAVSVAVTAALLVAALEAYRRHDRLFVDLL
jgi:lipopolysaccharide transport system permease protein